MAVRVSIIIWFHPGSCLEGKPLNTPGQLRMAMNVGIHAERFVKYYYAESQDNWLLLKQGLDWDWTAWRWTGDGLEHFSFLTLFSE